MKKMKPNRIYAYILKQIYNERHSNWALLAELLIVSCIVWYIVDSSYTMIMRASEPMGFDKTNCYQVIVDRLDSDAVGYDPAHPDSTDITLADRLALIDRIRHDEDIEAAAYSMRNDPYNGSSMYSNVKYDTLESNVRIMICEPDMMRVFRYKSTDGKTPEQLAALLKDRNIFLSEGVFGKYIDDLNKLIGKEMSINTPGDTLPRRLAGVVKPIKRFGFEEVKYTRNIIVPMINDVIAGGYWSPNLSIRVKDSHAKGFEERFRQKIKGQKIRAGNYYVSGLTSYDRLQKDSQTETDTQIRNNIIVIVFLLINVFLGLLGTFWFRTQHRFPEIGLQKAIGATNTDITLRLLAEGVFLLTIAFIPSLLIDFGMGYNQLTEYYQGVTQNTGRFIVCASTAYLMMLLIIALGIWFPALRATKANPVEVLRGE